MPTSVWFVKAPRSLSALFALAMLSALCPAAAPREVVRIVFPTKDERIYFSIPITSVVFAMTEEAKRAGVTVESLTVEIDGRPVPRAGVKRSRLYSGSNYAVFSSGAPWSVTEGGHRVTFRARGREGEEWETMTTYMIDTAHPTLMGLSGFILFPSSEALFSRSARVGVNGGGPKTVTGQAFWINLAPLHFNEKTQLVPIPIEMGVNHRFSGAQSGRTNFSWKLEPRTQQGTIPGVAVGQSDGSLYAVAGWHTNPNRWQGSLGIGANRMPSVFAGLAYSPSFYRLMIEGDNRHNFNYGLSLTHPRGFRLSLYDLQSGLPRRTLLIQLSLSRGF